VCDVALCGIIIVRYEYSYIDWQEKPSLSLPEIDQSSDQSKLNHIGLVSTIFPPLIFQNAHVKSDKHGLS